MSKLKLTPVLIGMEKEGYSKGDLVKILIGTGRLEIANNNHPLKTTVGQAQQFLLLSELKDANGTYCYNNGEKLHKVTEMCASAKCYRVVAAYPTLEGIPPITPEFMNMYCENPDVEIWMEMNHKLKCEICGSVQYLQDGMSQCMEYDCDDCGSFNLEISEEPRLKSGFIALEIVPQRGVTITTSERQYSGDLNDALSDIPAHGIILQGQPKPADVPNMESKVVSDYTVNEYLANDDKWVKENQDKPADVNLGENTALHSGKIIHFEKPADVPSEVMSFPEWFKSNYKGQSHHDFAQNRLCTEYARYYHTTLSQQPERKAEGMSAEEINTNKQVINFWQLCPKCIGQGVTSRPPYIAADVTHWSSTSAVHVCDVCNGAKILAAYKQTDNVVDWKQLEIDFCIECTAYNGVGRNISTQIFNFFKSRLSTSGVSDEKAANINESEDFKNFM